jgi:hypothetical protein
VVEDQVSDGVAVLRLHSNPGDAAVAITVHVRVPILVSAYATDERSDQRSATHHRLLQRLIYVDNVAVLFLEINQQKHLEAPRRNCCYQSALRGKVQKDFPRIRRSHAAVESRPGVGTRHRSDGTARIEKIITRPITYVQLQTDACTST